MNPQESKATECDERHSCELDILLLDGMGPSILLDTKEEHGSEKWDPDEEQPHDLRMYKGRQWGMPIGLVMV